MPILDWDYKITGYAGSKHQHSPFGEMLCQTVHKGEEGKAAGIAEWRELMDKGECSRIVIFNVHTDETVEIHA